MKSINLSRVLMTAILVFGGTAHASVTNAIWEAALTGTLGIQEFRASVTPYMSVAQFKKGAFLGLLRSGGSSETLAFNADMVNNQTNFYLSVYSTASRQNITRVTANEVTTIISDGNGFIFSLDADLPRGGPPTILATTWGGGTIRITGRGRMINGTPALMKGSASGIFIDTRPGDLNGTTGLVTRARFSTSGPPLRILPPH